MKIYVIIDDNCDVLFLAHEKRIFEKVKKDPKYKGFEAFSCEYERLRSLLFYKKKKKKEAKND